VRGDGSGGGEADWVDDIGFGVWRIGREG